MWASIFIFTAFDVDSRFSSSEDQNRELTRSIRREVAKLTEHWNHLINRSDNWKHRLDEYMTVSSNEMQSELFLAKKLYPQKSKSYRKSPDVVILFELFSFSTWRISGPKAHFLNQILYAILLFIPWIFSLVIFLPQWEFSNARIFEFY